MTNPESSSTIVHWTGRSAANGCAMHRQHQDNGQMFHLSPRSIPVTYLQKKEQTPSTYSRGEQMKFSDIVLTGILSSSLPFNSILSQSNPYSSSHTFASNPASVALSRKRKQPCPDASLFFTPSTPAKRSSSNQNSTCTQTEFVFSFISTDRLIAEQEELTGEISELRRAKSNIQCQCETTVEAIKRCLAMTRSLLIEKSQLEKKQARQTAMENRLRLGQFNTQRQGMSFIEQWTDGTDFLEKKRAQERLIRTRKNLDKDRKALAKRKLFLQQQLSTMTDELKGDSNDFPSHEMSNPMCALSTKPKRTGKQSTIRSPQKATSLGFGPTHHPAQQSMDSCGDSPLFFSSHDSGSSSSSSSSLNAPLPSSLLALKDWHEHDEVLRLRQLTLKREESELTEDLENLDRQRNLHMRELKRLYNEDQSRFNKNNILHDRYLLLTLIGKGGFSEVHRAFDLCNQRYVACKIHQLNKEWKDEKKANYIKHALREYDIHKHLEHQRIVKLFDVFEIDTNSFCTVLEYCDGNDLDFFLKQNKTIPEKEARSIIVQIVSALKYLNSAVKPPVIHYDLKPGNVLLGTGSNSGEIKITDFGLSKQMHEDAFDEDGMDLSSQGAGTYWYLPPEVFVQSSNPPKISSKVDVWSVGCIFYQCLYGRKPYGHNLSQADVLENQIILNATEIQFPNRPQVSSEAKEFMRRCLTYKVHNRPDVLQLSDDPYLKSPSSKRSTATSSSPFFCPK